ncbi:MAG: hypothetical protein HN778_20390 [Prolixibacteraceae bacterium]|nr:hypothetical protein [Prolixibacteraceae bacterium]MBT7397196.1 hypothetical protein [Prolixibacteraceae bacterium]
MEEESGKTNLGTRNLKLGSELEEGTRNMKPGTRKWRSGKWEVGNPKLGT